MVDSYAALCNDWYVNQRLRLKMDLPNRRDTVLSLFDRIRREMPAMDRFRRYPNELALESAAEDGCQRWVALRRTSVRSGAVNPDSLADAYRLHRLIVETAPFFLDISPLDVDYLEVLFGFDLLAAGNHDAIVFDALVQGSPLASLSRPDEARITDCQPVFGIQLPAEGAAVGEGMAAMGGAGGVDAVFEVKTRSRQRNGRSPDGPEDPISIYLTVRQMGPVSDLKDLPRAFDHLTRAGQELLEERVAPTLIVPIREAIVSGRF